jgi:hypothetical protein
MPTLKITASKLNIELDKGGTFRPIFYVLDDQNQPVNLTGYGAVMQVKEDYADVVPLFNLSVATGSITILPPTTLVLKAGDVVGGQVLIADLTIGGVYGLQPRISADDTSAIVQDKLVYQVDLIEPSLDVIKWLKGDIKLNADGTT